MCDFTFLRNYWVWLIIWRTLISRICNDWNTIHIFFLHLDLHDTKFYVQNVKLRNWFQVDPVDFYIGHPVEKDIWSCWIIKFIRSSVTAYVDRSVFIDYRMSRKFAPSPNWNLCRRKEIFLNSIRGIGGVKGIRSDWMWWNTVPLHARDWSW